MCWWPAAPPASGRQQPARRGHRARVTAMDVADIRYDADAAIEVDLRDKSSVDDADSHKVTPGAARASLHL